MNHSLICRRGVIVRAVRARWNSAKAPRLFKNEPFVKKKRKKKSADSFRSSINLPRHARVQRSSATIRISRETDAKGYRKIHLRRKKKLFAQHLTKILFPPSINIFPSYVIYNLNDPRIFVCKLLDLRNMQNSCWNFNG